MKDKIWVSLGIVFMVAMALMAQQAVEVRRITAPATGTKTAANSDSIVCATDTGCISGVAGGVVTNNSTTYSGKIAPDANLLGTLGTAFTTAGFVDIKGADGNVFVRQATAANLNATVVGTGTFATQSAITAASGSIASGAYGSDSGSFGVGSTGSAVPAKGVFIASKQGSGNLAGVITCDTYAFDRSSTADVSLVAISGSTSIYVCGYRISGESTTASDVSLEYGTGATCGTGTNTLTPPTTVGTSTSGAMIGGVAIPPGIWAGLKTPGSQRLCVHRSAAQTSEVEVWYTQF